MTQTISAEFIKAREDFAHWYDSKSEETQELIDEIADRTSYIIDEDEYDKFMEEIASYGITTAEQFTDAFHQELKGYGERVVGQFAEEWVEDCCLIGNIPEFLQGCIDYEMVWYSTLRYDFNEIEFNGNTYFLYNNF